jgi:hypothetical protein
MYSKLPIQARAVTEKFDIGPSEYTKLEQIGEGVVGLVQI